MEILLYLHPWTFSRSSLSSLPPCFWTSDTVHPELQSTLQTSTLQAGGEWGRYGGGLWGNGPGTDTVPPLALTPWILSYPFEPPSSESPGLICGGAAWTKQELYSLL